MKGSKMKKKQICKRICTLLLAVSCLCATDISYASAVPRMEEIETTAEKTVSAQAAEAVVYEAENGELHGTEVGTEHGGYHGNGYVQSFGEEGDRVTIIANVEKEGQYSFLFRYGNGAENTAKMHVYLNGLNYGAKEFPVVEKGNWKAWGIIAYEGFPLKSGRNEITIQLDSGDLGNANIDSVTVQETGSTDIPWEEDQDKNTYEAEEGELYGTEIGTEHGGYHGSGYVQSFGEEGDRVTIIANVEKEGQYSFLFRYGNGAENTARMHVYLNGIDYGAKEFPVVEKENWKVWGIVAYAGFPLKSGRNEITIQLDSGDLGNANIDSVTVKEMESTDIPWEQNQDKNTSVLGWEGDLDAAIAYAEGSFQIRDNTRRTETGANNVVETVGFHIADGAKITDWYCAEDYLPCLISEFEKDGCAVQIKNFADQITIDSKDYVAVYSRVEISGENAAGLDPAPSSRRLVPLENGVREDGTYYYDYVALTDTFGRKEERPSEETLKAQHSPDINEWDAHYQHMKEYWTGRIGDIAHVELPNEEMRNAYYATFIQCCIIKDPYLAQTPGNGQEAVYDASVGSDLIVGENGYDHVHRTDQIETIVAMLAYGDTKDIQHNMVKALDEGEESYAGATWKMAWPWAVYLHKTGDKEFVSQYFERIKARTHEIEADRMDDGATADGDLHDGVMDFSFIDTYGSWTTWNWAALNSLLSYEYICGQLGETQEQEWAQAEYKSLLEACNSRVELTQEENAIDYIPGDILQPNAANRTGWLKDGNWAVHLFNGRWPWEGYLFGADQEGTMKDSIDATYTQGIGMHEKLLDENTFGSFPVYDQISFDQYLSTAYNASYGAGALLGNEYRDIAIKNYEYMLEYTQSGPYSWWENIYKPSDPDSEEYGPSHATGDGSAPHMWGQMSANKTMLDAILSEKYDGTLVVGRGIPEEWIASGEKTQVSNFKTADGSVSVSIQKSGENQVMLEVGYEDGTAKRPVEFSLPVFRYNVVQVDCDAAEINDADGVICLPAGTDKVTVTLDSMEEYESVQKKYEAEKAENIGTDPVYKSDSRKEGRNQFAYDQYGNKMHLESSGSGYVQGFDFGDQVRFTVNVPADGSYKIYTRYANGNQEAAQVSLSVNGEEPQPVSLPFVEPTDFIDVEIPDGGTVQTDPVEFGAWDWWDYQVTEVMLKAGENTLVYSVEENDDPQFNLDSITVEPTVDKEALARAVVMGENAGDVPETVKTAKEVLKDVNADQETADKAAAALFEAIRNGEKEEAAETAITGQPQTFIGSVGEMAVFTVEAQGNGLTYSWEYCNEGSNKWRPSSMEGKETSSLRVPIASYRDGQSYRCVVVGADGKRVVSEAAFVKIGVTDDMPRIIGQPEDTVKAAGETAEFTVAAEGEGLTYQWEYQNEENGKWRASSMEGSRTATVRVPAASYRNGQSYRCIVTGENGRFVTSEAAQMTVTE